MWNRVMEEYFFLEMVEMSSHDPKRKCIWIYI